VFFFIKGETGSLGATGSTGATGLKGMCCDFLKKGQFINFNKQFQKFTFKNSFKTGKWQKKGLSMGCTLG
jgi:hypothetical protein